MFFSSDQPLNHKILMHLNIMNCMTFGRINVLNTLRELKENVTESPYFILSKEILKVTEK